VPIKNGFRSGYAYDNILFAVATLVIEQASGQSYADYIRTHLFQPVGMDESLIDKNDIRSGMNVATGYAKENFKNLKPVPPMAWSNDPGAGGIYTSVHDLAKWMNVQLAGGALPQNGADGKPKRIFSEDSSQMWTMLTPITVASRRSSSWRRSCRTSTATESSFRPIAAIASHTGGWPGLSRLTMVPEEHLGVVVLTTPNPARPSTPSPTACSTPTCIRARRPTGSACTTSW
jgi:CubicO group peptidase (beta-lactamase class C family)